MNSNGMANSLSQFSVQKLESTFGKAILRFDIDCNPRLVAPMSAFLAGLDLTDLLLRVSRGEGVPSAASSQQGVRSHSALQVLLGCAIRDQRRLRLLRECWLLLTHRSAYRDSREELTPVRWDWLSAIPLIFTVLCLLVRPAAASYLTRIQLPSA